MTDDQLNDLKQLIATTVKQTVAEGIREGEERIGQRFDGIEHEMRDGFAGIAEAFDPANDHFEDHERRITRLEQHAA